MHHRWCIGERGMHHLWCVGDNLRKRDGAPARRSRGAMTRGVSGVVVVSVGHQGSPRCEVGQGWRQDLSQLQSLLDREAKVLLSLLHGGEVDFADTLRGVHLEDVEAIHGQPPPQLWS